MADSYHKKSLEQKRAQKKKDKQKRKEERKAGNEKGGKGEDMIVYLDEFGNFTDIPPEKQNRREIMIEEIQLGAEPLEKKTERTGVVSVFFTDKAYGFITDDETGESVFVHNNQLQEEIKEKDKVSFKKEKTQKGYSAIDVKKI